MSFILNKMRDGKKVLECLRKAGKVATECLDPGVQAQLIVELVNAYVHFFHQGNQHVSLTYVNVSLHIEANYFLILSRLRLLTSTS